MVAALTHAETEILIDGLSDDVAFVWVPVHLGLRGNPPDDPGPPRAEDVDAALRSLDKLSRAGLLMVGHMEYVDGGPSGRVAPVKHVEDPIDEIADRVRTACRSGADWEWSCWVVNTPAGSEVARSAIEST